MMSNEADVGSVRPAHQTAVFHRPFEDSDTEQSRHVDLHQRQLMLRHQFPADFVDITVGGRGTARPPVCVDRRLGYTHPAGHLGLQDPLLQGPTARARKLAEDSIFLTATSMRSTAGDEMDDADDDDVVDSATGNITSNTTTPSNGQHAIVVLYFFLQPSAV